VCADGRREVLGFDVGDSEDGAFWIQFLRTSKLHPTTPRHKIPKEGAKTRPGLEPAYLGRTPQWATSVANTSVPDDESHSAEYSVGLT
jgi:hypothetical protein